jgi:hypothetical protein
MQQYPRVVDVKSFWIAQFPQYYSKVGDIQVLHAGRVLAGMAMLYVHTGGSAYRHGLGNTRLSRSHAIGDLYILPVNNTPPQQAQPIPPSTTDYNPVRPDRKASTPLSDMVYARLNFGTV